MASAPKAVSEKDKTPLGGELFIIDNSDNHWKGLAYLDEWTEIASAFDIASGFFEIGALLALDGKWLKQVQAPIGVKPTSNAGWNLTS